MMHKRFQSINHPEQFGYAYDSEQWIGNGQVDPTFRQYKTYGDNLTQHSGDWGVTTEFMADYCLSLAAAMVDDQELSDKLEYIFRRGPSVADIEFAASVRFKPSDDDYSKRRYFSLDEKKISSSSAKEHDKRYTLITKYHDGSPEAIYRLLTPEYSSGLTKYLYATAIRDWVLTQKGMYMDFAADFLKFWGNTDRTDTPKSRELRDAVDSVQAICQSWMLRRQVERHLENSRRNLAHRIAQAEAERAAAEVSETAV